MIDHREISRVKIVDSSTNSMKVILKILQKLLYLPILLSLCYTNAKLDDHCTKKRTKRTNKIGGEQAYFIFSITRTQSL